MCGVKLQDWMLQYKPEIVNPYTGECNQGSLSHHLDHGKVVRVLSWHIVTENVIIAICTEVYMSTSGYTGQSNPNDIE